MSKRTKHFYEFGQFRIDTAERMLLRDGEKIPLTPKAFDTLLVLVQNSGHTLTKDELMEKIWPDTFVEEVNLARNISVLRKALGEGENGHQYIETVPKLGYRFVTDVRKWQEEAACLVVERHARSHVVIEEEEETGIQDGTEQSALSNEDQRPAATGLNLRRTTLIISLLLIVLLVAISSSLISTKRKEPSSRRYTESAEAYEAYLKGRFFWNKRTGDGLSKSIAYFKQAIEKDSNFALAHIGLADAYAFDLLQWPKVEAIAKRALEIDPTLGEAHASLGFVRMFWEWKWSEAEREFKRAIELNPGYPTARQWYAIYLATQGWLAEAEAEMRRARELDPLSLSINADIGQILYFQRRYDEAIEQCRKTLDMDRDFLPAHIYLRQAYTLKGMYNEAMDEFFIVERLSGQNFAESHADQAAYREGYVKSGIQHFWRMRIDKLSKGDHLIAPSIAEYYTLLGESDRALDWLQKAYDERHFGLAFLKVDPIFDDLRADPKFAEIIRRMRFDRMISRLSDLLRLTLENVGV